MDISTILAGICGISLVWTVVWFIIASNIEGSSALGCLFFIIPGAIVTAVSGTALALWTVVQKVFF